ncbi:granule-bound starch synthase WX-TsB protein,related [Neospora caninum Liverpool]|uniref:Granule-bound starch synthase WX-TsB protein,related n=1 Tax=Neospora caninum (strain Liverpool) TaxID=572307 RepID=F0V8S0_NEOCL|nr:granule-bound starch synthase WX-TsB protein,related [Neospora caninum Liverpool]CBZ50111.1 granule-bound starch synthase WX-TsB protein,related [Neospora caninum Liverpool]|eukprot:XP_003880146.1 granule-bound starch synthase WX-TsB protein,related [Neospora caninum Liverpool]
MEIYSHNMEVTGKPQKPRLLEAMLSPRLLSLLHQLQTSPACASSSQTFDEALQSKYLRQIREELYDMQETCGVARWPPPVAPAPCADEAAGEAFPASGDEDGERLGWTVLLLKLHQTFASLLAASRREGESEGRKQESGTSTVPQQESPEETPLQQQLPGDSRSPASPALRIQTNEFEISSLWQMLQSQAPACAGSGASAAVGGPRGDGRGPMPAGLGLMTAGALLPSSLSGLLTPQGSLEPPDRAGSAGASTLSAGDGRGRSTAATTPAWTSMSADGKENAAETQAPGDERLPFDVVFELKRGCWTSVCRQQQAEQLREHQQQQSQLASTFLHSRPSSFRSLGSSSLPSTSTGAPSAFSFSSGPNAPSPSGPSSSGVYDTSGVVGSGGFGGPLPLSSRPPCAFCASSLASLIRIEERPDPETATTRLCVTLVIDSEVLHFCCCSGGRFDAYFTALIAHLILTGCGQVTKSPSLAPGEDRSHKSDKLLAPPTAEGKGGAEKVGRGTGSKEKSRRKGEGKAAANSLGQKGASPSSRECEAGVPREDHASSDTSQGGRNAKTEEDTRARGASPLSDVLDGTPNGDGFHGRPARSHAFGNQSASCRLPQARLGGDTLGESAHASPAFSACAPSASLRRLTIAFVARLRFPDFFRSSEDMVTHRAHHAMRVVLDSSRSGLTPGEAAAGGRGGTVGCWRMTREKFNWHVTLLTSAAVEAVRDCFADLTLDVWHSCFYGAAAQAAGTKCASRDRLEQLLIALLGNNDALIRLEAVKLLNAFYDRHDWQLRQPFVPLIKNVGDRFVLTVLIETCRPCGASPASSDEPTDVFAIVTAPSFSRASTAEIYSYHTFSWVCLQSLPPTPQSVSAAAAAETAAPTGGETPAQWRRQRWLGTADFGVFTRCGFYDWRICRAKESDGSWWVVERAVSYGALPGSSGSSFPTASAAVLSAPLIEPEAVPRACGETGRLQGQAVGCLSPKPRADRRRAAEGPAGAAAAHAAAAALAAAFPVKSPNPHHRLMRRFEEHREFDSALGPRPHESHHKKLLDECIPLQGRVVVLPEETRNLQLHEVFVDSHEAQWDEETGKVIQRGNFACIAESLPTLADAGVTATLVTGVMERDCGDVVYDSDGDFDYNNPDASPFASVCRAAPCGLLGGVGGFMEVVQEARRLGMKILVQMATGVSAAHPHRRYAPHLLHFEDADGKKQVLYGGETLGVLPQETAILNYRKLATWQLFIDDLKMWIKKFGIDGVRIPNAQNLPQLLVADAHALSRKDADGQFHYAAQDIIMGEVVVPHSSSMGGYWSLASLGVSSLALSSFRSAASLLSTPGGLVYANPFYVKLCRSVWLESPDFLFIGECWTELQRLRQLHETHAAPLPPLGLAAPAVAALDGHGRSSGDVLTLASSSVSEFSVVPSLLVSSGIVPQLHLFPTVLPAVLGKRQPVLPICPSSSEGFSCGEAAALRQTQLQMPLLPAPPRVLFSTLFAMHHNLPRGAVLIQASCTPASPLPALVYGRAAWAAVDLLMLLPDVPCTFAGEMEGAACRLGVPNVFASDCSAGRLAALAGVVGCPLGGNKLPFSPLPSPDYSGAFRHASRYGPGQHGDGSGGASRRSLFATPSRTWTRQGSARVLDAARGPYLSLSGAHHVRYPGYPGGLGTPFGATRTDAGGLGEGRALSGNPKGDADKLDGEEARPPHSALPLLERVRLIDGFESIRKMPMLEQEVQEAVLGSPDDDSNGRFDLNSIHRHYVERRRLRQSDPCLRRGRAILVDVRNPDGSSLTQAHRVYEEWHEAVSDFDASLPVQAAAVAACRRVLADDGSARRTKSRGQARAACVSAVVEPVDERESLGDAPETEGGDDRLIAFVRFDDERICEQLAHYSQPGVSSFCPAPSRVSAGLGNEGRRHGRNARSWSQTGSRSGEINAGGATFRRECSSRARDCDGDESDGDSFASVRVDVAEHRGHSLVLVVTNLSEKTLHDKSISLHALRPAFRQHRIKHWHFLLQMCDLLTCTCEGNLTTFLQSHQPLLHPSSRFSPCASRVNEACDADAGAAILPDVISIEELLSEPFLLPAIPPYSSLLRGFTLLPLAMPSALGPPVSLGSLRCPPASSVASQDREDLPHRPPSPLACASSPLACVPSPLACASSLYTSLFCCSLLRLQGLLRRLIHQSPGVDEGGLRSTGDCLRLPLGPRESKRTSTGGNMVLHILRQVAGDADLFASSLAKEETRAAELDLLAEFLEELAFALRYRETRLRAKQRLGDLEGQRHGTDLQEDETQEEESQPSAALSLFSICSDSKIFERHEELACTFMARLKRLVAGKAPTASSQAGEALAGDVSPAISLANEVLEKNSLGAICFVTPELGRWSTVGGLGVMVDELSTTLATELGQEVWVVSPYYDRNRKGEQDYLARDGIHHAFNVTVNVGGESITLGVHTGSVVPGVKLFFLHCASVFPYIYPDVYGLEQIRFIVTFAKAALEIFCHLRAIPPLIITNDWPTCLIPAYAKRRFFGNVFDSTTFYHIIHNLDSSYEGRIYLNKREDVYWLHGLPTDLLVDPHWHNFVINPSRCVLLQCDGWGTVSPSYRDELINEGGKGNASPLAPLLRRHHHPFATPNGIPIKLRLERLKNLGFRTHWEAKTAVQCRYFNFEKGDESIPLLAFIGRITQQKGVHLIVELAENLIRRYNGRVQILVGGMANWNDGYAARCANQMLDLRARFPHSFWADPGEFFSNGALVNLGADFGLMPSLFEPGGIVQHEFFIAGTPVIAFRTGGLKDTVREGNPTPSLPGGKVSVENARKNNGFTFDAYTAGDFLFAIERAMRVFGDRAKYEQLRANARASVVSCEESARAWLGEFARLRKKIPVNEKRVQEIFQALPEWSEADWRRRRTGAASPAFSSVFFSSFSESVSPKPAAGTVIDSLPRGPVPTSPFPPSTLLELLQFCEDRDMRMRAAGRDLDPRGRADGCGLEGDSLDDASPNGEDSESSEGSKDRDEGEARQESREREGDERSGEGVKRQAEVEGTFDDWRVRRPLAWDNALQAFVLSLALRPGKYFYKLVVDGEWVCVADAPKQIDSLGNENNFLQVP